MTRFGASLSFSGNELRPCRGFEDVISSHSDFRARERAEGAIHWTSRTTTRCWGSRGTPPRTRSRRPTGSWRASTTRTSTRTRGPRPSSRRSARPTRSSRTRRSGPSTTSSAPPGSSAAGRRAAARVGAVRRVRLRHQRRSSASARAAPGSRALFEMLFGGGGGRARAQWASRGGDGRRPAGGWARPGANQEVDPRLPLEEAVRGGKREIALSDGRGGEHAGR